MFIVVLRAVPVMPNAYDAQMGWRGSAPLDVRPRTFVLFGVACMCASVLGGVFYMVFVEALAFRYWPDHSRVPQDGRPHVVHTVPDQRFIQWTQPGEDLKNPCTFTDLASGQRIKMTATRESGDRANGPTGTLQPWREGVAGSSRTSVRCDSHFISIDMYVTPPPPPIWLDPFGPWAYAIYGPTVVGTGLTVVGIASAARNRWRRRSVQGATA